MTLIAKVGRQFGSTSFSRIEADKHYKKALEQVGQGNATGAEESYKKAIQKAEQAYQCNAAKYEVCQVLAESHFNYALLLEKQARTVEAKSHYQEAERYIQEANNLHAHDEVICQRVHKILNGYAAFLRTQGQEAEAKGRLKKAALFAPQAPFSDLTSYPAFGAYFNGLTPSPSSFFNTAATFSQSTVTTAIVSKKEADQVIQAFSKIEIKGLSDIQEFVSLTALNDIHVYSTLTRVLLEGLQTEKNLPLNLFLLGGLSVILDRRAKYEQVDSQLVGDTIKAFETLVSLLQNMHIDKNYQQVEVVLQTLSLILDQMVYFNMQDLKSETVRRLHGILDLVAEKKQPALSWRVTYIKQALIRVPENAAFLEAFKKSLPPVMGGLVSLTTFSLKMAAGVTSGGVVGGIELGSLWEAYNCFTEAFKERAQKKYEAWYGELRWLDLLIETNQLKQLGELLSTAHQPAQPWSKQLANEWFVLGLCDRLERLAYGNDQQTRDDALRLLGDFKEGKTAWGPHQEAKGYAAICLNRIAHTWSKPDIARVEVASYFPAVWHSFWYEEISQDLLNQIRDQVRDQAVVRQQMALMPTIQVDIAETRTAVDQLSVQMAQGHAQWQVSVDRLLPKPLEDWLPRVNEALAQHYQPTLKIQRISGKTLDLTDCYINLAIVEGKAQQDADKAKLKLQATTFYRPSSYEEVKQANLQTAIPLEKLFEKRKLHDGREDEPKRILIQGRAGIGKTTLCKKLVHTYLQPQELWHDRFDAVLWVPLRQLKTYGAYSIEELLKEKHFSQRTDKDALAKQLSGHAKNILFVLDGLDEVAADLGKDTKLGNFLSHLLAQPQVVVTSRPAGVDFTKLEKFDLELETIGFSQENVQTYLNEVEPKYAPKIQALIKSTPVMQELANIPVQLDVLCYSWKEIEAKLAKQKNKTPEAQGAALTMTVLYQEMVDKLWRKDAERLEKKKDDKETWSALSLKRATSKDIEQMIMADEADYLNYLSFKGLEQSKIEFDLDDLNAIRSTLNEMREQNPKTSISSALYEALEQTSFLHTADASLDDEHAYHFLHLTFQEFFAAKFLAKHFQAYLTAEGAYQSSSEVLGKEQVLTLNELQNFVAQHLYNPRYQVVWWMVAGLLEGNTLEGFFHLLEKAPEKVEKDKHIDLLMHSLHEARARLSPPTIARLEEKLVEGFELAVRARKRYWPIQLGIEPTFPESLLLKLIGQNHEDRDLIYQTLGRRQTLSNEAIVLFVRALHDADCDIEIILKWRLSDYVASVEAVQDALITRFKEEQAPEAIQVLTQVLTFYAYKVEPIQTALLNRFKEEQAPEAIEAIAMKLAGYADEIKAIQDALLNRFKEEQAPEAIQVLTQVLAFYAYKVEPIQTALLNRFKEEQAPEAIQTIAAVLAAYADEIKAFQDELITRFKEEQAPEAIQAIAAGLAGCADEIEAFQDALITRFKEEQAPEAIEVFTQVLAFNIDEAKAIQDVLLNRFKEEQAPEVIAALITGFNAAHVSVLKLLEERNEFVIEILTKKLSFFTGNANALQVLFVKRLEKETEPLVIEALAKALGRDEHHAEKIRVARLNKLEGDQDAWFRKEMADLLFEAITPKIALENKSFSKDEQLEFIEE